MVRKITTNITDDELRALVAKNSVAISELRESVRENSDAIKELRESSRETTSNVNKLTANINRISVDQGHLNNRIGKVTELVVVPGIRPSLNDVGRRFDEIVPNKVVKWSDGERAFEIDVFLDNGKEAMAVEIKTRPKKSCVDGHIQRLKTIRQLEDDMGIKNKTLYGAIAGVIINKKTKEYALEKGIYILEILEDKSRLNTTAPPMGKIAVW